MEKQKNYSKFVSDTNWKVDCEYKTMKGEHQLGCVSFSCIYITSIILIKSNI